MIDERSTAPRTASRWGIAALLAVVVAGCESNPPAAMPSASTRGDVAANARQARADTDRAFDLIGHGDYAGARPLLERAIAADAMYGPAHNDLGLVLFHQDRAYEAAWEFDRAAKLMPGRGEPRNNLGLVYESADKWAEAEGAYQAAVDLDPADPEFAGNLARVRIRRGERDEATRKLLELVVMKDPRPTWVAWARSYLHRMATTTTGPT